MLYFANLGLSIDFTTAFFINARDRFNMIFTFYYTVVHRTVLIVGNCSVVYVHYCLSRLQVSVAMVMQTLASNAQHAKTLLLHAISKIAERDWTKILQENAVCIGV